MQVSNIVCQKPNPSFEESRRLAYKAIEIFRKKNDFENVIDGLFPLQPINHPNWLEGLLWRQHEGLIILERGLTDIWYWEEIKEAKEMLDLMGSKNLK